LFTLLVVGAVLAGVEGLAQVLEPATQARSIPTPAPATDKNRTLISGFSQRQAAHRIATGQATPLVEDESRGWILPPSRTIIQGDITCRINSLGMRGPEPAPKGEQELRLLALGDSSVFGFGVMEKDVFVVQAATLLSNTLGTPVSWANGAVPGHDSGQALRTLKLHGARLAPDWVLIGSLWSDVYANFGRNPAETHALRGPLRHLATYRTARRLLAPWLRTRKVRWIHSAQDIGSPGTTGSRVALPQYLRNLQAMEAEARSIGARVLFVALPAPMDFDRVPVPETVLEYRAAMRWVADQADSLLVDGPALFRDEGADISWFLDQVHPSPAGHALLAQSIATELASAP
jgi:lysophospholipase L1-like esterase